MAGSTIRGMQATVSRLVDAVQNRGLTPFGIDSRSAQGIMGIRVQYRLVNDVQWQRPEP